MHGDHVLARHGEQPERVAVPQILLRRHRQAGQVGEADVAAAGHPGRPEPPGLDSAGRDGRIPTLGEVLVRTMLMADRSQGPGEGPSPAAVTVVPDTRGIGLFEFFQLDEAREAGLEAGRAAIRALREGGPG